MDTSQLVLMKCQTLISEQEICKNRSKSQNFFNDL